MADLDTSHIGDGIEWPGETFKWNPQFTGARFRSRKRKLSDAEEDQKRAENEL